MGIGVEPLLCSLFVIFFIAMLVSVVYYGKGSVFWWVFLFGGLGSHFLQLLPRFSGAYFVYYHSQCSWLVWFGWLLYCLKSNEILSPLLFFASQLSSLSILLHLFSDDAKCWPTVFCIVIGKLVASAIGSAVGSSVVSGEGV